MRYPFTDPRIRCLPTGTWMCLFFFAGLWCVGAPLAISGRVLEAVTATGTWASAVGSATYRWWIGIGRVAILSWHVNRLRAIAGDAALTTTGIVVLGDMPHKDDEALWRDGDRAQQELRLRAQILRDYMERRAGPLWVIHGDPNTPGQYD